MPIIAQRKEELRNLLALRDWEKLKIWSKEQRNVMSSLLSLLFEQDPLLAWRAIEALGVMAPENRRAKVMNIIRRLFWQMNDESAGIIWNAPEAVGEICTSIPPLIVEYGRIVGSFVFQSPFEAGVHRAMARMCAVNTKPFMDLVEVMDYSLINRDPTIRANAAQVLVLMGERRLVEDKPKILADEATFEEYDFSDGTLKTTRVMDAVTKTLENGRETK